MELYQRIEHLIGKKLPLYETTEAEVMVLQERVNDAIRLAKQVPEYLPIMLPIGEYYDRDYGILVPRLVPMFWRSDYVFWRELITGCFAR